MTPFLFILTDRGRAVQDAGLDVGWWLHPAMAVLGLALLVLWFVRWLRD